MPSFPSLFPDAGTSRPTDQVNYSYPRRQVKSGAVEVSHTPSSLHLLALEVISVLQKAAQASQRLDTPSRFDAPPTPKDVVMLLKTKLRPRLKRHLSFKKLM